MYIHIPVFFPMCPVIVWYVQYRFNPEIVDENAVLPMYGLPTSGSEMNIPVVFRAIAAAAAWIQRPKQCV